MDVFRFMNPSEPTKMEHGYLINGLTSKTWIERYQEAGEFTFVAPIRTGIREILPIGCFVSHKDTREIMIVEDHQIEGKQGDDITVTITGRSFETYLENRVVGSNQKYPVTDIKPYVLGQGLTWHQLVNLIRQHIDAKYLIDSHDVVPYVDVSQVVDPTDYVGPILERQLDRGSLYEHVLELLKIDNLGIKTIRPPGKDNSANSTITIHRGVDRSSSLIFNYDLGEIDDIQYLYSNRKKKNAVLVSGKWVELMVFSPDVPQEEVGYDRRVMQVTATDIDDAHDNPPEGYALELVEIALWYRGQKVLKEQNEIALKKAELPKNSIHRYVYRKDYDLGDLVGITGGYITGSNEATSMRIVEHVEVEDSSGQISYPTLAFDPPQTT